MIRRTELRLMTPIANVWVHTHPLTARVVPHQYTEFGESNRPRIDHVMREFDTVLCGPATSWRGLHIRWRTSSC